MLAGQVISDNMDPNIAQTIGASIFLALGTLELSHFVWMCLKRVCFRYCIFIDTVEERKVQIVFDGDNNEQLSVKKIRAKQTIDENRDFVSRSHTQETQVVTSESFEFDFVHEVSMYLLTLLAMYVLI